MRSASIFRLTRAIVARILYRLMWNVMAKWRMGVEFRLLSSQISSSCPGKKIDWMRSQWVSVCLTNSRKDSLSVIISSGSFMCLNLFFRFFDGFFERLPGFDVIGNSVIVRFRVFSKNVALSHWDCIDPLVPFA